MADHSAGSALLPPLRNRAGVRAHRRRERGWVEFGRLNSSDPLFHRNRPARPPDRGGTGRPSRGFRQWADRLRGQLGGPRGTGLPGGTTITPVDLAAGRALRPFTLPGQPGGIALIDHGTKLLVSLMDRGAVVQRFNEDRKGRTASQFPNPSLLTSRLVGLTLTPVGLSLFTPIIDVAFVGNLGQDLTFPAPIVNVVDLRTMVAEQPISLGFQTDYTEDLAQSATGSLVFVAGPRVSRRSAVGARRSAHRSQHNNALGLQSVSTSRPSMLRRAPATCYLLALLGFAGL